MGKMMSWPRNRSTTAFVVGCLLVSPVFSQDLGGIAAGELQRLQQREDAQRRQVETGPDVRLQAPVATPANAYPVETPCFPIRLIRLEGDEADSFQWALDAAAPALGRCLGGKGINTLATAVQNALVERGW
jgi:hemolysin activation/secretion protein